jgi:hypothetical protein
VGVAHLQESWTYSKLLQNLKRWVNDNLQSGLRSYSETVRNLFRMFATTVLLYEVKADLYQLVTNLSLSRL